MEQSLLQRFGEFHDDRLFHIYISNIIDIISPRKGQAEPAAVGFLRKRG
jgi:hypothetical protein